jgi:protein involved in polysaccharide export with SLBB domain
MRRSVIWLTLCMLVFAAASQAQDAPAVSPSAVTLQPGDVVRIVIWREEDLSGSFLVDENGVAVLPLIGEQRVTGIPLRELRNVLLEQYQAHLRNPSISVTPLRRINVLGEVHRPGLYEVDPTISLAGAIGMAGGATATGNLQKIRILRAGETEHLRVSATSTLTAVDVRSGDQIFVEQRSWFERNSTFVVSLLLSVTSMVISLTR